MQHMHERCSKEPQDKQKPRTEQHDSARGCNSVEAAGIEPAFASSQPMSEKRLTNSTPALAAVWQRNQGSNCQCLTLSGSDLPPHLRYIAERWDRIQPHVREAIFTLIDASVNASSPE